MKQLSIILFLLLNFSMYSQDDDVKHYTGIVTFENNEPHLRKLTAKYDKANFNHEKGKMQICLKQGDIKNCYSTIDPLSSSEDEFSDARKTGNTVIIIVPKYFRDATATFNGPITNFRDRKLDLSQVVSSYASH